MVKWVVDVECCYKSRGVIEAETAHEAEKLALTTENATEEYDDDCYTAASSWTEEGEDA